MLLLWLTRLLQLCPRRTVYSIRISGRWGAASAKNRFAIVWRQCRQKLDRRRSRESPPKSLLRIISGNCNRGVSPCARQRNVLITICGTQSACQRKNRTFLCFCSVFLSPHNIPNFSPVKSDIWNWRIKNECVRIKCGSCTRQSPWVVTGAFPWQVGGVKFCLRFSVSV